MSERDATNDLVPYLIVKNATEAIEYYKRAFGAEEPVGRIETPDGRVGHAELRVGNTTLYLADEHPEHGYLGPDPSGASSVSFLVRVPDVDAVVKRAVEAGGTLTRAVEDQFYGHRTGEVHDGFGYRWTLSTVVEELSEDELQRRAAKLYEEMQ